MKMNKHGCANDWVRDQVARCYDGRHGPEAKRFVRENVLTLRSSDELAITASRWLAVQKANLACWPYAPRTRAWRPLHEHAVSPIVALGVAAQ